MSSNDHVKNRKTKRKAVIRPGEIVAECLIGATCSLRGDKRKGEKEPPWTDCGHYHGTYRDRDGQWILCSFSRWAS